MQLKLSSLFICDFVLTNPFFLWEFIQRKYDERSLTYVDQGELVNNVGNKVALGSKGSNASAPQFSGVNSTDTMHPDEFDSSVATLNIVCSFDPYINFN